MSNVFNINRFGKMLAFDGKKYLHNFGITLAILCSLNIMTWLVSLIFGWNIPTLFRWIVISVAVTLSIIMVPAKAFGDINLPREGVRYAMLPVSNLEKYLSYVLFCVMTPVLVLLLSWGVDSLLTLLSPGGFAHYIKSFDFSVLLKDFLFDISSSDLDGFSEIEDFSSLFGSQYMFSLIINSLFTLGLFMFGNALFKTHKTGKTFGIYLGISYVITMIAEAIIVMPMFHEIMQNANNPSFTMTYEPNVNAGIASNIIHAIGTIALYVGLYFKMKTQKY